MELYEEIIIHALEKRQISLAALAQTAYMEKIVEGVCYRTLRRIKEIVEDDSLTDEACFWKIEEIVMTLEQIGSDGGARHDFG